MMILALTSDTRTPGQIYDAVNNIVQQRLSQVTGVGDVEIGGGSQPAVRVEISPFALNHYGVSLEDVRAAIQSANANRPKGMVQDGGGRRLQIYTSTGGTKAVDYAPADRRLPQRRADPALRRGPGHRQRAGHPHDRPVQRQARDRGAGHPAAGRQRHRHRQRGARDPAAAAAQLPSDIEASGGLRRTTSIRASLREIEITLAIAIVLVVLVVARVPAQRAARP